MSDTDIAWGYVRLSQEGRDASLDEQRRSIREYCSRNDLELETTRSDGKGTSGFDKNRQEYQLVREKLQNDEIDALVVRDRARLSRDFDDRLDLITEFRASGVEWHVVEAGGYIDVDDIQTAGIECLHAMMDHIKKMAEIERSRQAIKERQEKGYAQGRPPFGMQYDEKGQYLVPGDDFDTVMEILDLEEQGETYSEISDRTGVPIATISRVLDRREWYIERERLDEETRSPV